MSQAARAEQFHALHSGPEVLVLANGWDAASARLIAERGAKAVATSSAAVAWAHGYPDGNALPMAAVTRAIAEIARVIDAPLTADIEGGYSDDIAEVEANIGQMVAAGAVGINIEDGAAPPELLAAKIRAARRAGEAAGVHLFINARTDVYLKRLAEGEAAMAEVLRRAELYRAAGADGIFVPGPVDAAVIGPLVKGIALPVNVMTRAGMPKAARLSELGVRRLSAGGALFAAAYAALDTGIAAYLGEGDPSALAEQGKGCPNFNPWFAG